MHITSKRCEICLYPGQQGVGSCTDDLEPAALISEGVCGKLYRANLYGHGVTFMNLMVAKQKVTEGSFLAHQESINLEMPLCTTSRILKLPYRIRRRDSQVRVDSHLEHLPLAVNWSENHKLLYNVENHRNVELKACVPHCNTSLLATSIFILKPSTPECDWCIVSKS